jgi:hypothetical protein
VIPAFVCVVLLVFGVHEPDSAPQAGTSGEHRLQWSDARRLGRQYAIVVGIAAVLTLARFSEAFLVLRAQNAGLPITTAPLVMVVMSIVYALVSYPAGAAADRGHGPKLLAAGLLALIASDVALANANGIVVLFAGAALWGLHMGLTQGTAGRARRRRGTGRSARHRVRCVQSRLRHCITGCKRARGLALGRLRPGVHVLRRRCVHRDRGNRLVTVWPARHDASRELNGVLSVRKLCRHRPNRIVSREFRYAAVR